MAANVSIQDATVIGTREQLAGWLRDLLGLAGTEAGPTNIELVRPNFVLVGKPLGPDQVKAAIATAPNRK